MSLEFFLVCFIFTLRFFMSLFVYNNFKMLKFFDYIQFHSRKTFNIHIHTFTKLGASHSQCKTFLHVTRCRFLLYSVHSSQPSVFLNIMCFKEGLAFFKIFFIFMTIHALLKVSQNVIFTLH
jgi:hypothetical protein